MIRDLVERIAEIWSVEGVTRKAAALAYYTLFAFSPLVVIAGSVAAWFFGASAADEAIETRLAETFGQEAATDLMASFAASVDAGGIDGAGEIATLVAIGVLIYGAGRLLYQMQRIFDDLLSVRIRKGTPWLTVAVRRMVPFVLVLASGIAVAAAILMQAVVSWLRSTQVVEEVLPFHIPDDVSQLASTFLFAWFIIGGLYWLLPDGRLRARRLAVGAAVAAGAYTIGQRVFFWYVSWEGAQTLSGVAGTIVLFLVWVHFTMSAVLGGLILARAWAETHGDEVVPAKHAVRVTRVVDDPEEEADSPSGSDDGSSDVPRAAEPSDAAV